MRLIDADALITRMKRDPLYPLVEKYGVESVIDAEPTVDAIAVVRCVDCKHIEILNGYYYARCKWHGRLFDSFGKADIRTWFCADGERRSE